MDAVLDKNRKRARRKAHIRIKVKGTVERPRITVFRSNLHLSAQVIDDVNGNLFRIVHFQNNQKQGEDIELNANVDTLKVTVYNEGRIVSVNGEPVKHE